MVTSSTGSAHQHTPQHNAARDVYAWVCGAVAHHLSVVAGMGVEVAFDRHQRCIWREEDGGVEAFKARRQHSIKHTSAYAKCCRRQLGDQACASALSLPSESIQVGGLASNVTHPSRRPRGMVAVLGSLLHHTCPLWSLALCCSLGRTLASGGRGAPSRAPCRCGRVEYPCTQGPAVHTHESAIGTKTDAKTAASFSNVVEWRVT